MPVVRMQGVDYIKDNNNNEVKISNLTHLGQIEITADSSTGEVTYYLNSTNTSNLNDLSSLNPATTGATLCWNGSAWVECSLQVEEII